MTTETPERTWGGLRKSSRAELIEWHSTDLGDMPDADITVLLWVRYGDGTSDWASGWWDGVDWLDAVTGGIVHGVVMHWAQPEGPAC